MLSVMRNSWALLLGMMLLMLGNGIMGTLLGIRGKIEGFTSVELSYVMAAYSAGFLLGSRLAPQMIQRVGHVRVFSALGSLISAVLILFPVAPDWIAWALMRVVIGYCFAGVYISAESWLNASSSNENRGQALSAYMIVNMLGIVGAQYMVNLRDPGGFDLFIFASVLVSLAFAPILLSAAPAPAFKEIRPMPIMNLFRISPLGSVGLFLLGALFSALFGMASVWGSEIGLSVKNISIFIASIYVGGLALQYPIGWASDRWDRRWMILWLSAFGAVATLAGLFVTWEMTALSILGFLAGGIANPLYSLLVAYVNDYLSEDEMAGASAGLIFIYGLGSILGPLITGWLMSVIGPEGFFLFLSIMFAAIAVYALWRVMRGRRRLFRRRLRTIAPGASAVALGASLGRDSVMEADADQRD
jgi:MFS family permease